MEKIRVARTNDCKYWHKSSYLIFKTDQLTEIMTKCFELRVLNTACKKEISVSCLSQDCLFLLISQRKKKGNSNTLGTFPFLILGIQIVYLLQNISLIILLNPHQDKNSVKNHAAFVYLEEYLNIYFYTTIWVVLWISVGNNFSYSREMVW